MDVNYGPNSNHPLKLRAPDEKRNRRSSILKPPNSRRSIALGELNGNTPDARDRKKKSAGRRVSFAPQDDFWIFKKADAPSKTDGHEAEKLRSSKPNVNFSGGWSSFSDLKEVSELAHTGTRDNDMDPEDAEMNTDTIYEEMTRPRGTTDPNVITLSIAESDMDISDAHEKSDKPDSPPPGRSLKDGTMSRIPVPITQVSTAADHTASHSESFGPPVLDSTGPNPVGDGQGDAMAALFEGDNLSDVDMEETVALPIRVETFPANFNRQPSTSYQDGRATEVPENDTCNLAEEMELTKCLPSLLPQHTSTSKPNFPEFQRAPIPAPNSVSHQNPNANSGADYATTTTGASIQNPVQDSNAPASSVPVPLSVPEFTTAPTARAMAGSEDPYDHHVLNDSFEEDFGDGRADATVRMDMTELVGRGILQANGLLANEIAENSSSRSNENGAMASGDQLTANENTEFMDFTEVVGGVLSASGETGSTNANTGTNRNISTKKVHVGPNLGEQDSHIAPRGRNKVDERSVNTQVDMDTDTTNTMRMDMTEAVGGILHALPASGDHADRSELQHKQATGDTEPQSTDTDRMDMTEAVGRILNADEGTIKIPNFFLPVLVSDDVSESSGRRDTSSPPGSKRSSPRANEKTNENAENEREDVVAKRPRRESEQLVSTLNDLSVQPSGSGGVAMVTNQQLGRPDNSDRNGTTSSRPSEVARTDTHPNPANGTEPGQDTDRVVLHTDVANTHTHTPAPAHSGQDLSSHHGDGEPTEVTTHSHTQNLTHTHTHNLTTASTTGMLDVSSISHSPTTARSLNTTRVLAATQAGLLIAQSSVAMATAEPPIEATSTDQDQNTLVAMATRRGGSRLSVSRAPTPVKDLGPPTVNPISVHDFLSLSQTHFMDNLVTRRRTTMLNGKLVKIETLADRLRVACTLEPKLTLLEQNCSMLDRMTKDTRKKIEAQENKLNIHNPDIFQALRDASTADRASMRQILGEVKQVSRLQARNMWASWRLQAETRVAAMLGEKARVVGAEMSAWGPETRERIAGIRTKLKSLTEALGKERIALGRSIMDEHAYEELAHNHTAGKDQNVAIASFEGALEDLNAQKESAYKTLGELQNQQMQLKELIGTRHDQMASKQAKLAVWNALTPAHVDAMHDELLLETTLQQWYPQIVDPELVVFALQEGAFLIYVSMHPKIATNEKSQRIASIGVEQTHLSQETSSDLLKVLLDCGLFDDLTDRFTTSEQLPELLEELSFALERVKKLANEIDGLRNMYHMTVDPAASESRGCVDLQVDIIRASKGVRVTLAFKDIGICSIQALHLNTSLVAVGPVCMKTIQSAVNTYNGTYRRLEQTCSRVGEILKSL